MEFKQNPFSLYDFLGYLIPGALTIFGFYALSLHIDQPTKTLFDLLRETNKLIETSYVLTLLTSYCVGHLLSYISSVTIEKYSTQTIGYPTHYLLDDGRQSKFKEIFNKSNNKFLYFLNCFFLMPIFLIDFLMIEIIGRVIYKKNLGDLSISENLKVEIGKFYEKKFEQIIQKKENFFLLIYHFVVERSDKHLQKIQNYVALFGFTRTMTLIYVSFFWFIVIQALTQNVTNKHSMLLIVAIVVLCFISYLSFVKFYRRFSTETLMAFLTIRNLKNN